MNKTKAIGGIIVLLLLVTLFSIFSFDSLFKQTGFSIQNDNAFSVQVSLEHDKLKAGQKQIVVTKIINRETEVDDIIVKYSLWDINKEYKILEFVESVALQTSIGLIREIPLPTELESGNYVVEVEVNREDKKAIASSTFIVEKKKSNVSYDEIIILMGIFISLALIYLIYLLKKSSKK